MPPFSVIILKILKFGRTYSAMYATFQRDNKIWVNFCNTMLKHLNMKLKHYCSVFVTRDGLGFSSEVSKGFLSCVPASTSRNCLFMSPGTQQARLAPRECGNARLSIMLILILSLKAKMIQLLYDSQFVLYKQVQVGKKKVHAVSYLFFA